MNPRLVQTSKFLSLILRHRPETIGVMLDDEGWLEIERLLSHAEGHGMLLTREELEEVVATNDKQRFSISADGKCIRANQGHSLSGIDLGLKAVAPPETLFHGTVERFVESIRRSGLIKKARQHVHLSSDAETAARVGARRGEPLVVSVDAKAMDESGFDFYLSTNGVWLVDHVPPRFIRFPKHPHSV